MPSFKAPLDASVLVPALESKFCLAVNKSPLGLLKSKKYLLKRAASLAASKGAFIPPRKIKSLND